NDGDPCPLQNLKYRNPINARRLHGHRFDATSLQPIRHRVQLSGEPLISVDRLLTSIRWKRYPYFGCSDIDASRIVVEPRHVFAHPYRLLPFRPLRHTITSRFGDVLRAGGHDGESPERGAQPPQ